MISTAHLWGIIIAAVANFVLGWLWFGPIFGKVWMKGQTIDPVKMEEMKKKMMSAMVIQLVVAFFSMLVFFSLAGALALVGFGALVHLAFWLWLGFMVPASIGGVLWEGKSWSWYLIVAGNEFASLLIAAIVFNIWA